MLPHLKVLLRLGLASNLLLTQISLSLSPPNLLPVHRGICTHESMFLITMPTEAASHVKCN